METKGLNNCHPKEDSNVFGSPNRHTTYKLTKLQHNQMSTSVSIARQSDGPEGAPHLGVQLRGCHTILHSRFRGYPFLPVLTGLYVVVRLEMIEFVVLT